MHRSRWASPLSPGPGGHARWPDQPRGPEGPRRSRDASRRPEPCPDASERPLWRRRSPSRTYSSFSSLEKVGRPVPLLKRQVQPPDGFRQLVRRLAFGRQVDSRDLPNVVLRSPRTEQPTPGASNRAPRGCQGAADRGRRQGPPTGAADRGRRQGPPTGAADRGRRQGPPTGAADNCRAVVDKREVSGTP